MGNVIRINRAPVLTLWAAVVAEAEGYDRDTALSMGKAVAGLNAQAKGRRLGLYSSPKIEGRSSSAPKKVGLGEDFWVQICGRPVPAKSTASGVRAVVKDQPIEPDKVEQYLQSKFGEDLPAAREAMQALAAAFEPQELEDLSYELYERFRPQIEPGQKGWGQAGDLNLDLIRSLVSLAAEPDEDE